MKAWSSTHWPARESPHLSLKTESSRDPPSLEGRRGQSGTLLLVQPGPARNCGPPAEEEVGHRAFKNDPSTDPSPGFTHSPSTFSCWGVGTLLSISPRRRCSTTLPAAKASRSPHLRGLEQGRGGFCPSPWQGFCLQLPPGIRPKADFPTSPHRGQNCHLQDCSRLAAGGAHRPPPSQAPRRSIPGHTVTQGPT